MTQPAIDSTLTCLPNPTTPIEPQDIYYMGLAIEQARQGLLTTRPNPAVGCVIVKDNEIVGQGFHPKAGQPHAEVFALRQAADKAKGACAYVTLEPCSHTGRTPPCARALIAAKIKRVVIAGLDPNPEVSGQGMTLLRQAGIEVVVGVLQLEAEALNLGFLKAMRTGLPYVRLKIATSLDGRSAMSSGESKWITGSAARADVQRLRAQSAAIITGSQTIIDDNPELNVRSASLGVSLEDIIQPKIVILDRRLRLDASSSYTACQYPQTLFWRDDDLIKLLRQLVIDYQCYDILVEAGAQVVGSFIKEGLIDELIIYQAPSLLGNSARPMAHFNIDHLNEQRRFRYQSFQNLGPDIKLVLTAF